MTSPKPILLSILFITLTSLNSFSQSFAKGKLLYENALAEKQNITDWKMEGAGSVEFTDSWMHLFSFNEKSHHVLWCPNDFPSNFIAEWEVKNYHTAAGLCIVFFAAKGLNGESIFDSSLPARNGIFKKYTNGAINTYHISYYANGKNEPERATANLRKNKGFHLVQKGQPGIPAHSDSVYHVRLIKYQDHILVYINDRKIIDWSDDGNKYGKALGDGKIGFRQMKWTHFAYRNFKVWEAVTGN